MDYSKQPTIMANKHYDDIRLEVAENGFILCYTERKPGKGLENCSWDYKKEVYSTENVSQAIAKMTKLALAETLIDKMEDGE